MDRELREQFYSAILRFKKMGSIFPNECEIQMTELSIMQTIDEGCSCVEKTSMNLNVSEVQEKLCISKPAVSQILNSLEKKGYIVREIDPKDRRKIALTATPEGKKAMAESAYQYDCAMDELFNRFGIENMKQLIDLLSQLTEIFEEL